MFHGTDKRLANLDNRMMFLAYDANVSAAYGSVVHEIELSRDANIGSEDDLRELVQELEYDWSEERSYAWVECRKVRELAIERGFDGFEVQDCLPGTDGSDRDDMHDTVVVFDGCAHCTIIGLVEV
jgi:hypothetical protein